MKNSLLSASSMTLPTQRFMGIGHNCPGNEVLDSLHTVGFWRTQSPFCLIIKLYDPPEPLEKNRRNVDYIVLTRKYVYINGFMQNYISVEAVERSSTNKNVYASLTMFSVLCLIAANSLKHHK